ncbi:alkaline phosphatase family protein [Neptunitalea chrysea]|uniref:Alkaline phosphatase family protein n=1 Tax=Neptunitalea chrysea TaxID=1647581 RepID=A0A9W6B5L9_9FLAO|nr:ectonucleotide pyrophosphatase/phosphodiesterase [Neptunitalea chrysea]GLB53251.1 alkaline phosphatase family protein [Neptunitalea chrysea]
MTAHKHVLILKKILFIALSFFFCKVNSQEDISYKKSVKLEIVNKKFKNTPEAEKQPYVIMVSLDGFRYDYPEKYNAKNILEIGKNGSYVTRLIPSFPSKTFPNHYSIATGLYPAHHGIISNSFYDKSREAEYKISKRYAVEDGSWYDGVPLWNLAQQQGMCSASYFWVGSEANINGMHPTYYYNFNQTRNYGYRVDRVLEWLQLPEKKRPHMITLYFSLVDTQGHRNGPNSEKLQEAVSIVDKQIGRLRAGIAKLDMPVYLIVTADHGMDDLTEEINIHDFIDLKDNEFYKGPVAMIYTKSKEEKERVYNTLSEQTSFKTYKQEAVPNYLNFKNQDRIGDLVLVCDAPSELVYKKSKKSGPISPKGTHGYDPFENKNMGAIFYIEGPNIKKGYVQSAVENVHIYPLVAHLLGLKITQPIDGNLHALESMIER